VRCEASCNSLPLRRCAHCVCVACFVLTVRSVRAFRHRTCEYMHEDADFLTYCFEMLDEDEDELLNEDELRLWITTEGVLEISDFLLVTLDFYLATGKARMRALYSDLILT
jgi:hypothetical protein